MTMQSTQAEDIYTMEDIENNKTMAGLAYLLFFLPLIICPESRYAKFHQSVAAPYYYSYIRLYSFSNYPHNRLDTYAYIQYRSFDTLDYRLDQRLWRKSQTSADYRKIVYNTEMILT